MEEINSCRWSYFEQLLFLGDRGCVCSGSVKGTATWTMGISGVWKPHIEKRKTSITIRFFWADQDFPEISSWFSWFWQFDPPKMDFHFFCHFSPRKQTRKLPEQTRKSAEQTRKFPEWISDSFFVHFSAIQIENSSVWILAQGLHSEHEQQEFFV